MNEYSPALCPRTTSLNTFIYYQQHPGSTELTGGHSDDLILWLNPEPEFWPFWKGHGEAEAWRLWHPQPWIIALASAPTESMNQATSVNSFMSFIFFVEKLRMGLLTCILRRTRRCSATQQLVLDGPWFESQPCHLPAVWPGASYLISLCLGFLICKLENMWMRIRLKTVRSGDKVY